jgi:exonuclease III
MDPRKIFIWNVRGLNSTSRQSSIRSFIDSLGVNIVCLQESKMQEITRIKVITILGVDFEHFVYLPSLGASGEILVAWKRHLQVTGLSRVDTFSVSVQFKNSNGQLVVNQCIWSPKQ